MQCKEAVRSPSEISLEVCSYMILQGRSGDRFRRIHIWMIKAALEGKWPREKGRHPRTEVGKTFKWQGENGSLEETEKEQAEM